MHILNEPSFFLKNKIGAPQGEELGLMKPLSESSCSCFDNSFISDGAKRYGARATEHEITVNRDSLPIIGVASAPAIAGIVSYFAAFVTLQGARARVIALALGALGRISLILSRSQVVCFRDIMLLERLLVVSGDVIRLSL
nr:hypothetical protein [Tanacetum cinerariifolium]